MTAGKRPRSGFGTQGMLFVKRTKPINIYLAAMWAMFLARKLHPRSVYSIENTVHSVTQQRYFTAKKTKLLRSGHLWNGDTLILSRWCPNFGGFTVFARIIQMTIMCPGLTRRVPITQKLSSTTCAQKTFDLSKRTITLQTYPKLGPLKISGRISSPSFTLNVGEHRTLINWSRVSNIVWKKLTRCLYRS